MSAIYHIQGVCKALAFQLQAATLADPGATRVPLSRPSLGLAKDGAVATGLPVAGADQAKALASKAAPSGLTAVALPAVAGAKAVALPPAAGPVLCKVSARGAGQSPLPSTKAPSASSAAAPTAAKHTSTGSKSTPLTRRSKQPFPARRCALARADFTPATGCPWNPAMHPLRPAAGLSWCPLVPWACPRPSRTPPSCWTGTPVPPRSVPPKFWRA